MYIVDLAVLEGRCGDGHEIGMTQLQYLFQDKLPFSSTEMGMEEVRWCGRRLG